MKQIVRVRMSQDQIRFLDFYAAKDKITRSKALRYILDRFIKNYEELDLLNQIASDKMFKI